MFGKLTNSESAMGSVKIYLETSKGNELPSIYCETQEKNKCVVLSNDNGEFSFEHVPYGEYKLTFAHSHKSNTGVTFSPSSKNVVHSDVQTIHTVELDGVLPTINGQVVNTLSQGIKDVNIFVDGQQNTITNQNGKFTVKNVKIGEFSVEAHHKNYFMKPMKFRVTSTSHSENAIEKIVANYVSLCGQIDFSADPKEDVKNYKVKVLLEDANNKNKRATSADLKDNKFCFEVTDGQYIVKPTITVDNKVLNVVPFERKITIKGDPHMNANFSREKLVIKGKIEVLPGIDSQVIDETAIFLYNSKDRVVGKQNIGHLDKKTEFEFKDLFNENYKVVIKNSKLCFEQEEIHFGQESQSGTNFVVKGLKVDYNSDVTFGISTTDEKLTSETHNIVKGGEFFCLRNIAAMKKGVEFVSDDSFMFKNGMNKFVLKNDSKKLNFKMDKVLVQGVIKSDANLVSKKLRVSKQKIIDTFTNFVKIDAYNESDGKLIGTNAIKVVEESNTQDSQLIFQYKFYLSGNQKYKFKTNMTKSKNELLSKTLIYPEEIALNVYDECSRNDDNLQFNASIGLLIKGKINKEFDDYELVIKKVSKDDEKVFETFKTFNLSGDSFSVGPYSISDDYSIDIVKEDHEFLIQKDYDTEGNIVFTVSS